MIKLTIDKKGINQLYNAYIDVIKKFKEVAKKHNQTITKYNKLAKNYNKLVNKNNKLKNNLAFEKLKNELQPIGCDYNQVIKK